MKKIEARREIICVKFKQKQMEKDQFSKKIKKTLQRKMEGNKRKKKNQETILIW